MANYCVACGRPITPADAICNHCGKVLEDIVPPVVVDRAMSDGEGPSVDETCAAASARQPFQWKWAFRSAGLTSVSIFILAYFMGVICHLLFQESDRLDEAVIAFSSLAAALSYFIGGGLAAYFSPGRTIFEPAVGAAIAVVFLHLISANFSALTLGWIIPFGLGLLGAKTGEYFQEIRPRRSGDPAKG